MKIHVLERTQVVRARLEDCWAFFSNPANLAKITPDSLDFRVLSELPCEVYAGLMIRYRVRPLLGVPMTWVTEITHVREPHYFSDEQRIGPYAMWHHEHFFTDIGNGRVEMRDLVHYALPFGFIGNAFHGLLVAPQIQHIFDHREKAVGKLFDH